MHFQVVYSLECVVPNLCHMFLLAWKHCQAIVGAGTWFRPCLALSKYSGWLNFVLRIFVRSNLLKCFFVVVSSLSSLLGNALFTRIPIQIFMFVSLGRIAGFEGCLKDALLTMKQGWKLCIMRYRNECNLMLDGGRCNKIQTSL